MAGGDLGIVLSSPDGWTWKREPTPAFTYGSDLCVDGPNWIALGADMSSNGFITTILFRENDGSWSKIVPPALAGTRSLAYGQGKWISVGNGTTWASSTDGTNWTLEATALPQTAGKIAFAKGLWMAADSTQAGANPPIWSSWVLVLISTDGNHWAQTASIPNFFVNDLRYLNGRWLITGAGIAESTDGTNWTEHLNQGGLDIAYQGGYYYLANESGSLKRSTNLDQWEELDPRESGNIYPHGDTLSHFLYANGQWVGMGSGDKDMIESNDGAHWQQLDILPSGSTFKGLAFGDGRWVAVEGHNIWQSTDGLHWSNTSPPEIQDDLVDLAHGNGFWLAPSNGTTVYRSTNLITWSAIASTVSREGLFFGGRSFVAGSEISADGETWGPIDDPSKRPFAYENGYWFAADNQSIFYRSTNLKNWESINCGWTHAPS